VQFDSATMEKKGENYARHQFHSKTKRRPECNITRREKQEFASCRMRMYYSSIKGEDLQRRMPTSKAQVYAFLVVISRVVFVHVGHALSVNRLEATK